MKRLVVKLAAPVATLAVGAVLLAGGTPSSPIVRAAPQPSPAAPVDYGGKGKPPIVRSPFLRPYFVFSPEVPPAERLFVRMTVREANRFFTVPHEKDPPDAVDVYVFTDREALLDHYAKRVGIRPAAAKRRWEEITGVAALGWTSLDLSFDFVNRDAKRALISHEWFHLVDHQLRPREDIPYWLIEGMAEWAGWKAAVRFGEETSLDQVKWRMRALASGTSAPLRSLEAARDFYGTDPLDSAYAIGFWAIEYLDTSVPALLEFSRRMQEVGSHRPWEGVFRHVFGMPVERFYGGFERFRAGGFSA